MNAHDEAFTRAEVERIIPNVTEGQRADIMELILAINDGREAMVVAQIELVKQLRKEHSADDQLLSQVATVILNDKIADFIPFGLKDKVKERIARM